MGLNLHCGVKKNGVVGLKRSKKDQKDNLIMSVVHPSVPPYFVSG